MAGTMSLADLVLDLKDSLHDAAKVFEDDGDATIRRFLNESLPDMQWARPRTLLGEISLQANVPRYSLVGCPAFVAYKTHLWDVARPVPWSDNYPGATPRVEAQRDDGQYWLAFDPAPNWKQIGTYGPAFRFYYYGMHTLGVDAASTTVAAADRGLLLLRAQANAMRELAIRNAGKPVTMRDGVSGTTRNSTPAALHEVLMKLFREQARC